MLSSDLDIFLVGSASDITFAPSFGMYPSGTLNVFPQTVLKRGAISLAISRCCFWSIPTGTKSA